MGLIIKDKVQYGNKSGTVRFDNTQSLSEAQKLQARNNIGVDELLSNKVDKETGKGLSSNDYTNNDKAKLDGIDAGAQVNSVTGVKGGAEGSYRTGDVNLTPANIGLGNVDNTSDADKQVSTAQQAALNGKVDKVTGKGLSTNDYTDADKAKLDGINPSWTRLCDVTSTQNAVFDQIVTLDTLLSNTTKNVLLSVQLVNNLPTNGRTIATAIVPYTQFKGGAVYVTGYSSLVVSPTDPAAIFVVAVFIWKSDSQVEIATNCTPVDAYFRFRVFAQ